MGKVKNGLTDKNTFSEKQGSKKSYFAYLQIA